MWIRLWYIKAVNWAHLYSHWLHSYGFSPEWIRLWTFKLFDWVHLKSHWSHLNWFAFLRRIFCLYFSFLCWLFVLTSFNTCGSTLFVCESILYSSCSSFISLKVMLLLFERIKSFVVSLSFQKLTKTFSIDFFAFWRLVELFWFNFSMKVFF